MKLELKRLDPKALLPAYATPGAAAMDLRACLDGPLTLKPCRDNWNCVLVPTGLAMAIPQGYVGLIFARSGLASKEGISPANCVGVIDSDYRGEVKVALVNHGGADYVIRPGDRIAQLMITPVVQPQIEEVHELSETLRGGGGFGSTGK